MRRDLPAPPASPADRDAGLEANKSQAWLCARSGAARRSGGPALLEGRRRLQRGAAPSTPGRAARAEQRAIRDRFEAAVSSVSPGATACDAARSAFAALLEAARRIQHYGWRWRKMSRRPIGNRCARRRELHRRHPDLAQGADAALKEAWGKARRRPASTWRAGTRTQDAVRARRDSRRAATPPEIRRCAVSIKCGGSWSAWDKGARRQRRPGRAGIGVGAHRAAGRGARVLLARFRAAVSRAARTRRDRGRRANADPPPRAG